jgi:hypothetical protein
MRKIFALLCFLFGVSAVSFSQVFTDSNLPIIIIKTDSGQNIPDDPRVFASMKIIYKGPGLRNYLTDQNNPAALNYYGRINIETRGSSSQALEKKPYGFTTKSADITSNENVSLLGLPSEHDWLLNSLAFDPSLIRDYISYNLARQMGEYATRTVYCEVVINGNYKGLYLLQEKIKSDKNRVDILEITPDDNTLPNLSGGYITKADKDTGGDPVAFFDGYANYIHHEPSPDYVTSQQNGYVYNLFKKLNSSAVYNNTSLVTGFPSIIDVPSFVDFMLINELAANVDAYQYSTYFHKDRNGKLRAGPIWDLNLTYGNDLFRWGLDRSHTDVWQFANSDNNGSSFWQGLFNNSLFKCYLSKRWHELTLPGNTLSETNIFSLINEAVGTISEAAVRETNRWPQEGFQSSEIGAIELFVRARTKWMNDHMGPYQNCSNVSTPALVISGIMYHPLKMLETEIANDHEFIEILNNSDQINDLTGVYFSGTGLVFQFPVNSKIGPHKTIQLASDSAEFRVQYGHAPFGQYTRHLSDKGQSIVLADGFGNEIDRVEYLDSNPWPVADGNGLFLKLADPNSDNNLAQNWTAISGIVAVNDIENERGLLLYPNPVISELTIKSDHLIERVQVFNMQGRLIQNRLCHSGISKLDMSNLQRGFYLVKVFTQNEVYNRKIVKE